MPLLHDWPSCAFRLRKAPATCAIFMILVATLSGASFVHAETRRSASNGGEVDTEHLFGFTEGSDIGDKGEREVETDSTGRFGKLGGSYRAIATAFEYKYTIAENFRISGAAKVADYDIAGVSGLNNRHTGALQSVSFNARCRMLDREHAPFGLTLSIESHLGFVDDKGGGPADQYRADLLLIADRELLPNRLFGAINIGFEPEQTRLHGSNETARESTLGVGAALSLQVMPGVFVGAEARNLRHYDGLGLNAFAGQALYVGPTFFARLTERLFLSAAWNVQAWGAVAGSGGALDLTNFERHQVKLRLGFSL
jgi:hypothetical protein